jgi:hypothetical protein
VHGGLHGQGRLTRAKRFRAIVGGEDDDRVFRNAQVIEGVEQLADIAVDLHEEIAPASFPGSSLEIRMGQRRKMRCRIG